MPTVIETARLHMRPFAPADLDDLYRLLTNPQVRQYLCDDQIVSRQWVGTEIGSSINCFQTYGFGLWSVFPRKENILIGLCGFRFFHKPPELQLIYTIAPTYWLQGLATEAARAMLRYGFEELKFTRIITSADAPNAASLRVMEKAGMTFEKRVLIEGQDIVYYALMRENYQSDEALYSLH